MPIKCYDGDMQVYVEFNSCHFSEVHLKQHFNIIEMNLAAGPGYLTT